MEALFVAEFILKRNSTINVVPTGKSGPLAQYINETIYVSAVGPKQITLTSEEASADTEKPTSKKQNLNMIQVKNY